MLGNTWSLLDKYEPKSMHDNLPVIWDRGKGCYIYSNENKEYLDFTSGIFVTNVGHNNKKVIKAVKEQASKLLHSYTFATEIRAKFLFKLMKITPDFCEKAFLLSTGAEAIEAACKLIRMHNPKKPYLLSYIGAMHGKTMLAEQLKGNLMSNQWANTEPNRNIFHLPFPQYNEPFTFGNMKGLSDWKELIGGVIIESYQGWSARFYPKHYIKDLVKWARRNNILVCFDEIQSGIGRTGKLFAFEHYEVEPDLVCTSKGLGGGLPLSAVIGRKELFDVDGLSSTQSGNPVCCAAGIAVLDQIEELIKDAQWTGLFLDSGLMFLRKKYEKYIKETNCKGLVGAIIFNTTEQANKVVQKAFEKELLLVKTGRESIKIGPPLVINSREIFKGINIIDDCIKEVL